MRLVVQSAALSCVMCWSAELASVRSHTTIVFQMVPQCIHIYSSVNPQKGAILVSLSSNAGRVGSRLELSMQASS